MKKRTRTRIRREKIVDPTETNPEDDETQITLTITGDDIVHVNCESSNEDNEVEHKLSDDSKSTQIEQVNSKTQENQDNKFACSLCPKKYKYSRDLTMHLRIHSGQRNFICSYCNESFTRSSYRDQHEQRHNRKASFKCPQCTQKFKLISNLSTHIKRKHPQSFPFVCSHFKCRKPFAMIGFLNSHLKKVHGVKDDKCLTCQLVFRSLWDLERHYKTKKHKKTQELQNGGQGVMENSSDNETSFECDGCSRLFKTKPNLRRHQKNSCKGPVRSEYKSHKTSRDTTMAGNFSDEESTGIISDDGEISTNNLEPIIIFECNLCLESFPTEDQLQNHQMKLDHNEESPHECPVCHDNFETIYLLGYHFAKHRPNSLS